MAKPARAAGESAQAPTARAEPEVRQRWKVATAMPASSGGSAARAEVFFQPTGGRPAPGLPQAFCFSAARHPVLFPNVECHQALSVQNTHRQTDMQKIDYEFQQDVEDCCSFGWKEAPKKNPR